MAPGLVFEVIWRLENELERIYYTGISHEKRGMARLRSGSPGAGFMAYDCFTDAMKWYEKSEKIAPEHNNDPVLRLEHLFQADRAKSACAHAQRRA